jgi:outer membrane protein
MTFMFLKLSTLTKESGMTSKLVVAAMVLGLGVRAQAADAKIGYVDLQKAIQQTSAGKKAKSDLEKEFNAKKADLQKKEADNKKMGEDLEKKKVALSDDVRAKKSQELQQEMMKFQKEVGESQMNIQKKERDLTAPIIDKLQGSIERVAKAQNYTMVLEKSEQSVLWAQKNDDLTEAVVKDFESKK